MSEQNLPQNQVSDPGGQPPAVETSTPIVETSTSTTSTTSTTSGSASPESTTMSGMSPTVEGRRRRKRHKRLSTALSDITTAAPFTPRIELPSPPAPPPSSSNVSISTTPLTSSSCEEVLIQPCDSVPPKETPPLPLPLPLPQPQPTENSEANPPKKKRKHDKGSRDPQPPLPHEPIEGGKRSGSKDRSPQPAEATIPKASQEDKRSTSKDRQSSQHQQPHKNQVDSPHRHRGGSKDRQGSQQRDCIRSRSRERCPPLPVGSPRLQKSASVSAVKLEPSAADLFSHEVLSSATGRAKGLRPDEQPSPPPLHLELPASAGAIPTGKVTASFLDSFSADSGVRGSRCGVPPSLGKVVTTTPTPTLWNSAPKKELLKPQMILAKGGEGRKGGEEETWGVHLQVVGISKQPPQRRVVPNHVLARIAARYSPPPANLRLDRILGVDPQLQVYEGRYAETMDVVSCVVKKIPITSETSEREATFSLLLQNVPGTLQCVGCHFDAASRDLWVLSEPTEGTLQSVITSLWSVHEAFVADVAYQLLRTLRGLHARGLAHMNVRPENVHFNRLDLNTVPVLKQYTRSSFLAKEHRDAFFQRVRFKLGDVTAMQDESKGDTAMVGHSYYMAPEVFQGKPRTCSSDIWSLGITLLHLADGEPPLSNCPDIIRQQVIGRSTLVPHLAHPHRWSSELNDFLSECLIKDPKYRKTADELLCHSLFYKWRYMFPSSWVLPDPLQLHSSSGSNQRYYSRSSLPHHPVRKVVFDTTK